MSTASEIDGALERGPQAGDDLFGRFAQIECPPLGVAAVDRDLLEGLDQVGGAIEVGDQLLGRFVAAGDEFVELGATDTAPSRIVGREMVAAACKARRHRQADADRVVDLVRDAGDQAAERRQLLRFDQALLRFLQLPQRSFRAVLRCLQLHLGLAFGDGVLAEHLNGPRHFADFVARIDVARRTGVVAGHDGMHGVHQRAQWPHDAGGDRQADQDRNRQRQQRDDRDPHSRLRKASSRIADRRVRSRSRMLSDRVSIAFAIASWLPSIASRRSRARAAKLCGQLRDAEPPGDRAIAERARARRAADRCRRGPS